MALPGADPRPVVPALIPGRGRFPLLRVAGAVGGTEQTVPAHRCRGWYGYTGTAGWRAEAGCCEQRWVSSINRTPTQTLPVETSTTASPACRGSHPSAAALAGNRSGAEDAPASHRFSAGSQGFGCLGSDGDLQSAGRRTDYGSVCSSSRWTGRQICLLLCALLLPKRPRGRKIFADVIFHFPDLLKLRADY